MAAGEEQLCSLARKGLRHSAADRSADHRYFATEQHDPLGAHYFAYYLQIASGIPSFELLVNCKQ